MISRIRSLCRIIIVDHQSKGSLPHNEWWELSSFPQLFWTGEITFGPQLHVFLPTDEQMYENPHGIHHSNWAKTLIWEGEKNTGKRFYVAVCQQKKRIAFDRTILVGSLLNGSYIHCEFPNCTAKAFLPSTANGEKKNIAEQNNRTTYQTVWWLEPVTAVAQSYIFFYRSLRQV